MYRTQIQHGNIKVKEGDLSIAFVFRSITATAIYDNVCDMKVVENDLLSKHKNTLMKYDKTRTDFYRNDRDVLGKFVTVAKHKMIAWGWLT